jgi:putative transposase
VARKPRVVVVGYPHHVVQRGHNRKDVFPTDADRRAYLRTLAQFRSELNIRVYGYCLMTNHVHLIIAPQESPASLSVLMKNLAGRHAQRLNKVYERSGSAWEGRFKCSPIKSDRYLLACSRYVDLNPVRAGLVSKPEDYAWSSYRAKAGLETCAWLDPDPCFQALATTAERRQSRYREFVAQGVDELELAFLRAM